MAKTDEQSAVQTLLNEINDLKHRIEALEDCTYDRATIASPWTYADLWQVPTLEWTAVTDDWQTINLPMSNTSVSTTTSVRSSIMDAYDHYYTTTRVWANNTVDREDVRNKPVMIRWVRSEPGMLIFGFTDWTNQTVPLIPINDRWMPWQNIG